MHILQIGDWLQFCVRNNNQSPITMNRFEFEELELQVQQSKQPLKSYLQQIGVSYSTYHYQRRKCSGDKYKIKKELNPISIKHSTTDLSPEERIPQGVAGAPDKPCGEAVQMLTQNCCQTIHEEWYVFDSFYLCTEAFYL